MRVTWNKRYITLAPVATILGLAFRLYDPDHLLSDKDDIGITLALVPTNTPGVQIGRRHFPAGQAFQNGPTQGRDVFIPMDYIIGGQERVGQGWRMLMDCLAAGRAISLPALGTGRRDVLRALCRRLCAHPPSVRAADRTGSRASKTPLARIGGYAYGLEAARRLTAASLDKGEQPSVLSAILKYHATERMRTALNDALDIHGGRAICDGPRNYLFGVYMSVPVAITVEGANILTRSLIIFGQGAIRCHPYLLKEMEAANLPDPTEALRAFDKALFAHMRRATSNVLRAFWHNLTFGMFASTPSVGAVAPMYRGLHDGGGHVRRGRRSRDGDARRRDEAAREPVGAIGRCALRTLSDELRAQAFRRRRDAERGSARSSNGTIATALYTIQTRLDEVLKNLPARPVAWLLRLIAFPLGRHRRPPSDTAFARRGAAAAVAVRDARSPDQRHLSEPERDGRDGADGACVPGGGRARPDRREDPQRSSRGARRSPICRRWWRRRSSRKPRPRP